MEGGCRNQEKNSSHVKAHRVHQQTVRGGVSVWEEPLGQFTHGRCEAMLVRSVLSLQMARGPCTMVSAAHGSAA